MKQNGSDVNRCLLYFFIYCPLGSLCPLIGQYLSSIGFSGTQVGIITSLGTGSAILAGLLWGRIYANTGRKTAAHRSDVSCGGCPQRIELNDGGICDFRADIHYDVRFSGTGIRAYRLNDDKQQQ